MKLLEATRGDAKLKNQLIGALRRTWHRSSLRLTALNKQRRTRQEFKKNGEPRAKLSIFYECEQCGYWGKSGPSKVYRRVHVDHIDPVVPLSGKLNLTWADLIKRMFTTLENLQVLCSDCHTQKTNKERKLRK